MNKTLVHDITRGFEMEGVSVNNLIFAMITKEAYTALDDFRIHFHNLFRLHKYLLRHDRSLVGTLFCQISQMEQCF